MKIYSIYYKSRSDDDTMMLNHSSTPLSLRLSNHLP